MMLQYEKEYFERPVYSSDTQCDMDLMSGKIVIQEVPFAYRGPREFNCAYQYTKSLPYMQAEIERMMIKAQIFEDMGELRRKNKKGSKREQEIMALCERWMEEDRLKRFA